MSKNVIIAIVVIVIIIAGIVWYMNQADTTDVIDTDTGTVDMNDNGDTGSFTTPGDDSDATDTGMDAGATVDADADAQ